MYERMLNRQITPTIEEMAAYCGENSVSFILLNEWLRQTYETVWNISFPYGNHYGWCVAHRKKAKLICNIFAENNAVNVMLRLTDKQFLSVYEQVLEYTQEYIDNKYPCGDGGWIHYRITCKETLDDAKRLLSAKFS